MANLTININIPKELASQLVYLETISKKSKDFYIKEALIRYLEDIEDLQVALKRLGKKTKTYTSEEAKAKLNLK